MRKILWFRKKSQENVCSCRPKAPGLSAFHILSRLKSLSFGGIRLRNSKALPHHRVIPVLSLMNSENLHSFKSRAFYVTDTLVVHRDSHRPKPSLPFRVNWCVLHYHHCQENECNASLSLYICNRFAVSNSRVKREKEIHSSVL